MGVARLVEFLEREDNRATFHRFSQEKGRLAQPSRLINASVVTRRFDKSPMTSRREVNQTSGRRAKGRAKLNTT